MQTNFSLRYATKLAGVFGKATHSHGVRDEQAGASDRPMDGAEFAAAQMARTPDPEKPGAGAVTVAGPSEKPKGPFPGTAEKPGPPPNAAPAKQDELPKTPEKVVAQFGRAQSFAELAKFPDKTDPVDLEERPKSVARPKDFKNMTLRSGDRAVCYGDAQAMLVDKYGKARGEKTYENVFVNASGNFGWTAANDVPKEKLKMLQELGMPRPSDLRDVSHRKLWVAWQKHTEGGKKKVGA